MDKIAGIHVLSRAVIVDQQQILLCKTMDFTDNFYFLPGGHIEHNESALSALLRELIEEADAKCQIKRFLGCLEYNFKPDYAHVCHDHEYNLIFEVESDELKADSKVLCQEKHIELI